MYVFYTAWTETCKLQTQGSSLQDAQRGRWALRWCRSGGQARRDGFLSYTVSGLQEQLNLALRSPFLHSPDQTTVGGPKNISRIIFNETPAMRPTSHITIPLLARSTVYCIPNTSQGSRDFQTSHPEYGRTALDTDGLSIELRRVCSMLGYGDHLRHRPFGPRCPGTGCRALPCCFPASREPPPSASHRIWQVQSRAFFCKCRTSLEEVCYEVRRSACSCLSLRCKI